MPIEIVSTEPATGATYWRGAISDVDAEVEVARNAIAHRIGATAHDIGEAPQEFDADG